MSEHNTFSVIQFQIMWDRLISVVEEQAQALIRTGFSTSTREAGDVSAGVFNTKGEMLAQAVTGTPGHVNSMARAVVHFLHDFPVETMKPGDSFITNDPWKGTGHLHDFTVVTPTFFGGQVVGLFACTCHVVDVGGRGMGPDARQVYEEGIHVPLMYLAREGTVDATLTALIRTNVREPVQVVGDIYSLAACNDIGGNRLIEMMEEFGIDTLDVLGEHILEKTKVAMLEAIAAVEPGTYSNTMRVDGYDRPIDLVATLTIADDHIIVDFDGTSPPSSFGINVPFCYTEAYTSFGVKCIVAPKVPNNAASLAPIIIRTPENCILNAKHPLPVATRHITGQLLPDVTFGCLAQAKTKTGENLPVPAEGTSCLWNLFAMGGPGRVEASPETLAKAKTFTVMSFHSGGAGARPGKDGLSATAFPSGVRNVPVEITEAGSPIIFLRKEYRVDSGGAGLYRGGLGQVMEVNTLDEAPFAISANYDRVDFPPRGRDGGLDGAAGILSVSSGKKMRGKGQQTVPYGDRLLIEMPGGGGIGHPFLRPVEKVQDDVAEGRVSLAAARRDYGVVLDEAFAINHEQTALLRQAMIEKAGLADTANEGE
ncbi:hydantoinase B/oxoprolinase family protein [Martelella alba]|uniref:Hydantoinase B/oxoprolinase family protein n=1 Tax=Martelella alba TaxID=2590451 RepID=A0A506UE49_9HYPH|nr:hydantoinase B/oxoprolinase family protein [Martelella alba]TPW32240.1 hydantoinase B/oxoprolinase family protein [Martelella alba]